MGGGLINRSEHYVTFNVKWKKNRGGPGGGRENSLIYLLDERKKSKQYVSKKIGSTGNNCSRSVDRKKKCRRNTSTFSDIQLRKEEKKAGEERGGDDLNVARIELENLATKQLLLVT